MINTPDFETSVELMASQWNKIKIDISNGNVKNLEMDNLKLEYEFFNHFDQIIENTKTTHEINLNNISLIYRGVREGVKLDNYERMIPKKEYANQYNRMNPPGEAFIYLAVLEFDRGKSISTVKRHVLTTVIKELRATSENTITVCEMQLNNLAYNKKIFCLCGDSNIPEKDSEFGRYLIEKCLKCKNAAERAEVVKKIISKVYFNLFSSNKIFIPVNTEVENVRKYEYSPFHLLANYFKKLGYAGIMYRSTVHKNGTNLVLFDTDTVSVKESTMEQINVEEFYRGK